MKRVFAFGIGSLLSLGCLLFTASCQGSGDPSASEIVYPSFPDLPEANVSDFTLDYYPDRGGFVIGDYQGSLKGFAIPDYATVDGERHPIVGIAPYAFEGRDTIEDIRLGSNFTRLDTFAFHGCSSLKTVVIPLSVKLMDIACFAGCNKLEAISLPYTNLYLEQLFSLSDAEIESVPSSLKTIAIAEGQTEFELACLNPCKNVTSISLPSTITTFRTMETTLSNFPSLTYNEYEGCRYLGNAKNPYQLLVKAASENLKALKVHDSCTAIADYAFQNMESIQTITLPSGLTHIGQASFQRCRGFKEIVLPESLVSIGAHGFEYCDGLEHLDIPDSLISIGSEAFSSVRTSLYHYDENGGYLGNAKNPYSIFVGPTIAPGSITFTPKINENCRMLSECCFYEFTNIKTITIPDSVERIGSRAFYYCTNLERVTCGSGLKAIEGAAFADCTKLSSVTLPASLTEIPNNAFYNCTALHSIEWPSSLKSIGGSAFWNAGLYHLNLPSSVEKIGDFAFGRNPLSDVVLPEGITVLRQGVFKECEKIVSIEVPQSVIGLEDDVFSGCYSLQTVELPDQLEVIGNGAFAACKALRPIVIPDSVLYMGYGAFKSCSLVTIRCKASSAPKWWDANWNPDNRPVVWNYK